MTPQFSELSANVVSFCRQLRDRGLSVGPAEEAGVLQALSLIRIEDPEEFRLALRTILPGSRKELALFDDLYPMFWGGATQSKSKIEIESAVELLGKKPEKRKPSLFSWNTESEPEGEETAPGYSPAEILKRKDFEKYDERDVEEAIKIMKRIARVLARRLSRRYRSTRERFRLDFRRTMRLSLRNAGEVLDLAYRRRAPRQVKIVLLCDVSGSMEKYSRFLITFLYALQHAYGRIETFVFSTSLHRVTESMRADSLPEALRGISDSVRDWSGGTRIGECFQSFLEQYGRILSSQDTVVLILSDGWDIGEPVLLEDCVRRIRQKSDSVVWMNPLLGSPGYEPSCQGMQAALPHVDLFLPAHNLESLQDLASQLTSVNQRKRSIPAVEVRQ